jgi:Fe-S cluster assembly iron-binding protein IscA
MEYIYELYNNLGTQFKERLDISVIDNYIPNFSSQINLGFSEIDIKLKYPFDDYSDNIDNGNVVKIYKEGRTESIYEGIITKVTPTRSSSEDFVQVSVTPYQFLASVNAYRLGASYIFNKLDSIEGHFADVIDQFQINTGISFMWYGVSSLTTTGKTITYYADTEYCNQSFYNLINLIGTSGYYYRFEPDGEIRLGRKGTTASHIFTIGLDVETIEGNLDTSEIVNRVFLAYGSSPITRITYEGSSTYIVRELMLEDSQIQGSTEASLRITNEISNKDQRKIGARITVNSGYSYNNQTIEDVKVGDTCTLKEVKADFLTDNMMITEVAYNGNNIDITLESVNNSFEKNLNGLLDKRENK